MAIGLIILIKFINLIRLITASDAKKAPGRGASGLLKGAVTYFPTFAVSSAWQGLTSLFGMGRGGALALSPP